MASTTDGTTEQRTLRGSISEVGLRRIAFSLVVLVFFGLFVFFGFWRDLVFLFVGWFDVGLELFAEDYEAVPPHRIHVFVFALVLWTAAGGLLVQFRSPRKHVAGQWMALVPWFGLLVALVLSDTLEPLPIVGIFGGLTLLATVLHPAGRDLLGSFAVSRVSLVLLALVIVAAAPLLAFSATQIGLQTGAIEPAHDHGHDEAGPSHEEVHQEHVDAGHFAGTAAFGLIVVGVGLLASLRPDGWWLPAWFAGLATAIYGLAAVAFPEAASSVEPIWGLAAILWGVVFVAAAELTQGEEAPSPLGRWRTDRPSRQEAGE